MDKKENTYWPERENGKIKYFAIKFNPYSESEPEFDKKYVSRPEKQIARLCTEDDLLSNVAWKKYESDLEDLLG